MADATYENNVYMEQGGDRLVVASGGSADVESGGEVDIESGGALKVAGVDVVGSLATVLAGVALGYKLARGQVTPTSASHTVVTGLATVVAAVAVLEDAPTLTHMFTQADIGDQAGTPAAGSILVASQKPTGSGDVTPIAATTPWGKVSWIAVGT